MCLASWFGPFRQFVLAHRLFRLTSLLRRHRVAGWLLLLLAACSTEAVGLGAGFDDVRLATLHSTALQSRGLVNTCGHSEKGRLVVTMMAAFSARSAMTWNSNSVARIECVPIAEVRHRLMVCLYAPS